MRELKLAEIEALSIGAWVLGGGGSPYLAWQNMRQLYGQGRRVSPMRVSASCCIRRMGMWRTPWARPSGPCARAGTIAT